MSIIHLAVFMNAVGPIICALCKGIEVGGALGALVGGIAGTVMGTGNVVGHLSADKAFRRWIIRREGQKRSTRLQENVAGFTLVYLAFVWAIISAVLSMFITQQIIHWYQH
ncbi:MAG: hypothetical protein NT105_02610 [Verrucomicrobia bacterium]|nr:hypothetical protein [Verrucomicrobiota bacterium]